MTKGFGSGSFHGQRTLFITTLCIALGVFIVVTHLLSPFGGLDRAAGDTLMRLRAALHAGNLTAHSTVNIVIDDAFVAEHQMSIWNREVYGRIVDALEGLSPAVIAFDIVLRESLPDTFFRRENARLTDAVARSGRVIFPLVLTKNGHPEVSGVPERFVWKLKEENSGSPPGKNAALAPFAELLAKAKGAGSINLNPDPDGITRQYPLLYRYGGGFIPSYALLLVCEYTEMRPENISVRWGDRIVLRGARFYGGVEKDIHIPIDSQGCIIVNYPGPWLKTNTSVNASALLDGNGPGPVKDAIDAAIDSSIVLICDLTTANRDYTPGIFEPVFPSVGTITAVVRSILAGDNFRVFSFFDAILTCLIVLALVCFVTFRRQAAGFVVGACMAVVAFAAYDVFLFFILRKIPATSGAVFALIAGIAIVSVFRRIEFLSLRVTERTADLAIVNAQLEATNRCLAESVDEKEEALRRMETAVEQKLLFIRNLSHDTKTPLMLTSNSIESYARMSGPSKELDVIRQNIAKLCTDMENFFDTEKMEKGESPYDHSLTTDFSRLLEERIGLFRTPAKKKSIDIEASVEDGLIVQGDPVAMDRIILNLLDNAVRYAPRESTVHITLRTTNESVELSIDNEGREMSAEERAIIFEPYTQLSRNRKSGQGMGLGLPIVRGILDSVGGTIAEETPPAGGVRFVVGVPHAERATGRSDESGVEIPRPVSIPTETTPEDSPKDGVESIMIVEDNPQLLVFLRKLFIEEYAVVCARNGREALEKLAHVRKPDIIITDVVMDEMDGDEFFRELSDSKDFGDIPVIFMSARATQTERIEALARGVVDYLVKPFAGEELTGKVKAIFGVNKKRRESDFNEFENRIYRALRSAPGKNMSDLLETYNLTQREREIVRLLQRGLQYKEISDAINLSVAAVRKRIHSIYGKFGVQNRTELFIAIEKKSKE